MKIDVLEAREVEGGTWDLVYTLDGGEPRALRVEDYERDGGATLADAVASLLASDSGEAWVAPCAWYTREEVERILCVSRWPVTEYARNGWLRARKASGGRRLYSFHAWMRVAELRGSSRVAVLSESAPASPVEREEEATPILVGNAWLVALAFREEAPAAAPPVEREEEERAPAPPPRELSDAQRGVFAIFSARGWRDLSRAQVDRVLDVRAQLVERGYEVEEARAWIVGKLDKIKARPREYHAGAVVAFLEVDAHDAAPAAARREEDARASAARREEEAREEARRAIEKATFRTGLLAIFETIRLGNGEIGQVTQSERRYVGDRAACVFSCRSVAVTDAEGKNKTFQAHIGVWEDKVLKGAHLEPLRVEFFKRAARDAAQRLASWPAREEERARVLSVIDGLASLWLSGGE